MEKIEKSETEKSELEKFCDNIAGNIEISIRKLETVKLELQELARVLKEKTK